MGGSSSKAEVVKPQKNPGDIINYMDDEKVKAKAEQEGIDPALVAYEMQKQKTSDLAEIGR